MAFGSPVIGLDIGSSSIKVVQLKQIKNGYKLANFGMAAIPPEAIVDGALMNTTAIVEVLKNLLSKAKIKGTEAVIGLSGHSVIIKMISMPIMNQEELEDAIHLEAEQYIPFDINDVELDATILNPTSTVVGQMDVVLVAAKKEMIQDYSAVVSEAGLSPSVIDVNVYALQNAFEINYEIPKNDTILLCNIGASVANLNIITKGFSSFTRDIPIGGNQITEEIQRQLGLSFEEAEALKLGEGLAGKDPQMFKKRDEIIGSVAANMAVELQRSVDFYTAATADSHISRLYICGGCSKVAVLLDALELRLGIPVEAFNPFKKVQIDASRFDSEYLKNVAPMAAVCIGLGSRKAGDR